MTAIRKGTVAFLALQMQLVALEMKAVVVRAGNSKKACQCPRCKLHQASQVSQLRSEINEFIDQCKAADTV